jgi:hypothetical protein
MARLMGITPFRWKIHAIFLSLFFFIQSSIAIGQAAKPKTSRELWQEVRDYGAARVLAQLNIRWRPEPRLAVGERVLQRKVIAEAQQRVLTELAGSRYRIIALPQDRPFLLLEVEEDALAALEGTALVTGIARDPKRGGER